MSRYVVTPNSDRSRVYHVENDVNVMLNLSSSLFGWVFTKCGMTSHTSVDVVYESRPKKRRMCKNCMRVK